VKRRRWSRSILIVVPDNGAPFCRGPERRPPPIAAPLGEDSREYRLSRPSKACSSVPAMGALQRLHGLIHFSVRPNVAPPARGSESESKEIDAIGDYRRAFGTRCNSSPRCSSGPP